MNVYELIGVILGDGYIRYNPTTRIYGLEITGDAKDDQEYFANLSDFIETIAKKKPKLFIRNEVKGRSLRLSIYSKKFAEYLIHGLSIAHHNKTFDGSIPEKFIDWKYSKHIIRGLFETDGSIYFSKSRRINHPSYPRIELVTSSKKLALQMANILKQKDFNIHTRTRKSDKTFRLYLSGSIMLEKWVNEIGFSSMKKFSKYLLWKKYGYYLPKITYAQRLIFLGERGTAATAVDG